MRLRIALTIRLDRDREQAGDDEQPAFVAGPGEHLGAGDTTTGLGFTGPGPRVDEAWEGEG